MRFHRPWATLQTWRTDATSNSIPVCITKRYARFIFLNAMECSGADAGRDSGPCQTVTRRILSGLLFYTGIGVQYTGSVS